MAFNDNNREALRIALENQVRRLTKRIGYYDRWDRRISLFRLIVFLAGLILSFLAAQFTSPWLFGLVVLIFLSGFIFLIILHHKIDNARDTLRQWRDLRSDHLARMSLNWERMIKKPSVEIPGPHPFARDLDIVGPRSLLELIDTCVYPGGNEKLAGWLLETTPDPGVILKRRQLVEELVPLDYFRDHLRDKASASRSRKDPKDWDMSTLIKWLQFAKGRSYRRSLLLLGSLSGINIALFVLFLAGLLAPYFILSLSVYLLIYNFNGEKIKGLFDDASQIETLLKGFRDVLQFLETWPYKASGKLADFCTVYWQTGHRPSVFIRKIIRLAAAASSQKSDIVWAILNLLVPWDLYFAHRLNLYKTELDEKLPEWLDRFYELEGLCALANFAWLNPDYTFPVLEASTGNPPFEAAGLGHPLIPRGRKVTNDITVESIGSIYLITGSNMAGKSTFLRTLGINICLSLAGGPVNAQMLRTMPFRLFSSINVSDSLGEGLSHFYAEVRHLRSMLDELDGSHQWPMFFLVDEIFKGTNNRERLIGTTALLKNIAGKYGVGFISTHDLELAGLDREIPELSNRHFEETIKDGKMSFQYKLKEGPCPTTNALKIMQMEGLPIDY